MLIRDRGRLVAVLPAALDPNYPQRVVSHPGATYGGIVVGYETYELPLSSA